MEIKRYKPAVDKLFVWTAIVVGAFLSAMIAVSLMSPVALFVTVPTCLVVVFFLVSPLFGYVELREKSVFIKLGFIMKREIPYDKIRGVEKARRFYSDSMLSLKSSLDHLNIKYNTFDIMSISVVESDGFVRELSERCQRALSGA